LRTSIRALLAACVASLSLLCANAALAVTAATRSTALPTLPTAAEAARRPGFEVGSWFGFVLPAKLPDAIARRLAANVAEILALPEVKARFDGLGMETAAQTPAPFNAFIAQEFAKWRKMIKRAGIEAQ